MFLARSSPTLTGLHPSLLPSFSQYRQQLWSGAFRSTHQHVLSPSILVLFLLRPRLIRSPLRHQLDPTGANPNSQATLSHFIRYSLYELQLYQNLSNDISLG